MSMLAAAGIAVLSVLHFLTVVLAALRYRPATATPPPPHPSVSLLRPVCGLDRYDVETLESAFLLDDPVREIIFCAASVDDPACAAIRDMIARHPGRPAKLLVGEQPISGNPKLNNLAKGWAEARGDYVAMADANLLLPPDYLVRQFAVWTGDCALVTSPPAGMRPGNLWGEVECAFLNGFQGRWQMAADSLGLGFAQGKSLLVRRDWLDAAGGLSALGTHLAEDVALTRLVRERGGAVALVKQLFEQPIGHRRLGAVWGRQLRWSRVRRDGFPGLFALEIFQGAVPPSLLLVAVAPPAVIPPFLALWFGAEVLLCRACGWPSGWRSVLAMMLHDLALPALWVATFARRGFYWRGNTVAPALGAS